MLALPFADPTPVPTLLQRLAGQPGTCLLDGDGSAPRGRFSFLSCAPARVLVRHVGDGDPLAALDELGQPADVDVNATPVHADAPHPGQVPEWAGYVAYDAVFEREGLARRHRPAAGAPVLYFGRYAAWLALDHTTGRRFLVGDDRDACEQLRHRLQATSADPAKPRVGEVRVDPAETHLQAISEALRHIGAGDIYQVNLARRFSAAYDGDPLALWQAMCAEGDVPLGMFLSASDEGGAAHAVMCRSMECFLRWDRRAGTVHTAPIKGTIARSGTRDAQEADALRADPKERAEHAMIVDLMRNDLGRFGRIGSVRVRDLMAVEPYAGLSHLVSTVTCGAPADLTPGKLLAATFPPGSVTGTPKRRAVEIIEALEPHPRGVYTGALGHVDRAGGCNLAVGIRTATVRGGVASYHAGGGIVEASDPRRELAETELKARPFVEAMRGLSGRAATPDDAASVRAAAHGPRPHG